MVSPFCCSTLHDVCVIYLVFTFFPLMMLIAIPLCRCCHSSRPLSMGENDKGLRKYVSEISGGRYKPPARKTSNFILNGLAAKGNGFVKMDIKHLREEQISPSLSGDIWGENGIALLAILIYYITAQFEYKERVLICKGFSGVDHTFDHIRKYTVDGCVSHGLGENEEDVQNSVHGATSDEGSNMVKAWNIFEGIVLSSVAVLVIYT